MNRAILIAALLLAACSHGPDEATGKPIDEKKKDDSVRESWAMPAEGRFELKRVQDVSDYAAYNGYRSIYVIIDKETGKEFIGVSGVGISETGQHKSGKSTVKDER